MEDLLRLVIDEGGSDLHLSVGSPPAVRLRGELVKLGLARLTPDDTELSITIICALFFASISAL